MLLLSTIPDPPPWHNTLVELLKELKEAAEAGNEEERQIALEI